MSELETKNLRDIKPNPSNPRKISDFDFNNLVESIRRFGDLSGVIENETTGHLVGAHQRLKAFEKLGGEHKIIFDTRFDAPNKHGTIAIGRFEHEGELFGYRLVRWDKATEIAASRAANRIQGQDDLDLLAEANQYLIEQGETDLLAATGQTPDEINDLLKMSGVVDQKPEEAPKEPPMVIRVQCDNDQQMSELFEELKQRGLKVKVV
jgi:hypothetical protein